MHNYYENARNMAVDILRKESTRSTDLIRATAEKVVQAMSILAPSENIDLEALIVELLHLFSVTVQDATVLEDHDPTLHTPWLPDRKGSIKWRFWNRYMTYLEREFGMPPTVVNSLHALTDMILERIEEPARNGPWDRRGMVVGSVQSGKTANYVGLINKAVDAGYKLVIVLAGIHSNLRAQTQLRVDEGVLGFDTQKTRKLDQKSQWVGVGKLPGEKLVIHSLTSSDENGDFNKTIANTVGVMIGSDPVVLVIKKNSSVLKNLVNWVLHVGGSEDAVSGKKIIRNVPLLLIDDEADNASINTKDRAGSASNEVTAINGRIRQLLDAFEKSAYVGYTATPFANIFINPDAETPDHGEDLFPRSFIINVKPPSNYVGPSKVFGLDGDVDAGIPAMDELDIVREIDDYAVPSAFPPGHRSDHHPTELPASLRKAIRCFILTCAARRARGQEKKHNSMLIHVTRFVNVQGHVVELVRNELMGLQRRIEFGDGNRVPTLRKELQDLWESEFVPVSQDLGDEAGAFVCWQQVDSELHAAAAKIQTVTINGFAKEALDYKDHENDGRSVIAVGGDKLSRGLTLEGLSVSYFLRTTRMYDALMQMGRWFGYRPGYLDLCRLFTTGMLKNWYRYIALADEELRREFDYMVVAGLTPEKYGLRVRTHPTGMIVTALNKMSHGETRQLSWAGTLVQTTDLPKELSLIRANLTSTEKLLTVLGAPDAGNDLHPKIWRSVKAELVASFIAALKYPALSAGASGEQLATFIRKQHTKIPVELTEWTVVLLSNAKPSDDRKREIEGHSVGLLERNPESQTATTYRLNKSNILSPADESRDFENLVFDRKWYDQVAWKPDLFEDRDWLEEMVDQQAYHVALELTKRWKENGKLRAPKSDAYERPNGRVLRILRPRERGLLLIYPLLPPNKIKADRQGREEEPTGLAADGEPIIGVALSFPPSETALGCEYRVNRVWKTEMEDDDRYDDDD
ncbi:MAG: endonuclease [Verrucomicrobiales bacterium VVV1]|nr:MAG: endonuclease [Verrucomicrobiales bacterium VVV1]